MRTAAVVAAAAGVIALLSVTRTPAQAPATSRAAPATAPALKTAWGEPDLQGIWTDETTTPLQRPARYANQEFFTDAERAELDRTRSEILGRERRAERGTERDVSGSYNNVFVSFKRTGARTSLIVDPRNGRIPPLTPEAQKLAGAEREFRLALLQSTDLQEQGGRLQRRQIRCGTFAAICRTFSALQHRAHESQRWSGG
jgi:hypothetical protein